MKAMKKENIIIITMLVVMVIAIIGVSYAAFNYSGLGTKVNTITTGAITMTYQETSNTISLNGALPTTDKTGKVRLNPGEYFDFTVSSEITGNVNINYEISAKDVTTSDRKIDGSNIKLYLTEIVDGEEKEVMSPKVYNEETTENEYTGRPTGEMSLYTSSMNSSEEHHYRLRMYVTEEYNPQGDGGNLSFSVQINVYGKDGDRPLSAGETVIENLTSGSTYDDGVDTFITGEDPNNYIWYSGKLWRAVSVNNSENTTKLVTQWNISTISYNEEDNAAFAESDMKDWLNDTTVDGFLYNLREPNKFLVTDAKWDVSINEQELGSITKPAGTTTVTSAVGLLNMYEYQTSYTGTTYSNGYLNNGLSWWTLTPYSSSNIWFVNNGAAYNSNPLSFDPFRWGVRPSINLKSSVRIVNGDGTISNPYRLEGDNDNNLSGTLLNTRYSGEYIRFEAGENNLYRIVSHENGSGTKITSAENLHFLGANGGSLPFDSNRSVNYSSSTTMGTFLNGDYLTSYVDSNYNDMIEDNTTWYLGTVGNGTSYKFAKYTDETENTVTSNVTQAKVGLLRLGELMAGAFGEYDDGCYWTLTPYSTSNVNLLCPSTGVANNEFPEAYLPFRPSLNLKSNVIITGGDGTKNNPFTIALATGSSN